MRKNFEWGRKLGVGVKNKDLHYYESFRFNGVEYFVYDCVYLHSGDDVEPALIGKLVKLYEKVLTGEVKVKVVWFFRPSEIRNFLGDYVPRWDEIFLASGEGVGLTNINPVNAIIGKCNVVCTSKDQRNPQPSEQELTKADYIFCRTFDVGRCRIFHNFEDNIAGIRVENFFNKKKNQRLTHPQGLRVTRKDLTGKSDVLDKVYRHVEKDKKMSGTCSSSSDASSVCHQKNQVVLLPVIEDKPVTITSPTFQQPSNAGRSEIPEQQPQGINAYVISGNAPIKRKRGRPRKYWPDETMASIPVATSLTNPCIGAPGHDRSEKAVAIVGTQQHISNETSQMKKKGLVYGDHVVSSRYSRSQVDETTKRARFCSDFLPPNVNDAQPCKKRKITSIEESKVSENAAHQPVQDGSAKTGIKPVVDKSKWIKKPRLTWERLRLAHETGTLVSLENLDPSFTSSEVEDLVWKAFRERVDARMIQHNAFSNPHSGKALVIFRSKEVAESAISKLCKLCLMVAERPIVGRRGTLRDPSIPTSFAGHLDLDKKRSAGQRKAVSTAHCSQPNSIEYDMAMEWRVLQEKSDIWWKALYERQRKEIEELSSKLKMNQQK